MPDPANTGSNGKLLPTTGADASTSPAASGTATDQQQSTATVPLNNTRKRTPDEYTKNFDLNEISPLRTSTSSSSASTSSTVKTGNGNAEVHSKDATKGGGGGKRNGSFGQQPPVILNMSGMAAEATSGAIVDNATFLPGSKRNNFKGTYERVLDKLDISEQSRRPFLIVCALCLALLVAVIVLAAIWPQIPAYMLAPVCVEKECLDASAQVLLWSNTSSGQQAVCQQPYEWVCGRFDDDIEEHPLYGFVGGEWSIESTAEYNEMLEIHSFVAQLPATASSTAQLMLKRLHADCMKFENVDKSQADFSLSKAIRALSEWVYGKDWVPHAWDFRSAMITAHSRYGLAPFYRVAMRQRNSPPFGNIIAVSEGRLGLPHKWFYNLAHTHPVVRAYKMLMRDFAINYGTVAERANKFAEEMFNFEKRITNALPQQRKPVVLTLGEVQRLAPMLPIFETITTTFANTKLDDRTPVWIEDRQMLAEMSIIVSTTDVAPLNSFLVWSLARQYLPFMSTDYRAALRHYDSVLYGHKSPPPTWYQCAKLLHDWVPFAVDALRYNPELVVNPTTAPEMFQPEAGVMAQSERLTRQRSDHNRDLVQLLFAHLRHQMARAVDDNMEIDTDATKYITDRLAAMQLHIGLPVEARISGAYVNAYYADFLWTKLMFIDNLESRWSFVKRKMDDQMVPTNRSDKIVSTLYPVAGEAGDTGRRRPLVQYSIDLNAIVVADRAVHKPYFHHKYPLAINFARIGEQISRSLLQSVHAFGEQFAQRMRERNNFTVPPFTLVASTVESSACLQAQLTETEVPAVAHTRFLTELTATKFTAKAFAELQRMLAANRPVPDADLADWLTYDRLGLRTGQRQAGMQQLDDAQLYALATMQSHCGRSAEGVGGQNGYQRFRPFVEGRLAQRVVFDHTWRHAVLLRKFLHCPPDTSETCS